MRYGMNPHQPASLTTLGPRAPFSVVAGEPSYINVLDALTGWQLVHEAAGVFGRPAAASYKHVSPAGAALGTTVTDAYRRARDADPTSSYGDFVAVSHPVDLELAQLLKRVVSDGIIAPAYEPGVVDILAAKKRGTYLVLEADPDFEPPLEESRDLYGVRLTQHRDAVPLTRDLLSPDLPPTAADDLLLGLIVVRYTQSNTIAFLKDGMTIGIGAGQQSRIDCTRLAATKATTWWSRHADDLLADAAVRPLADVAMVSDGALPFPDNVEEAARHGVAHIAEPAGSIRSDQVAAACARLGITWSPTGLRLFRH